MKTTVLTQLTAPGRSQIITVNANFINHLFEFIIANNTGAPLQLRLDGSLSETAPTLGEQWHNTARDNSIFSTTNNLTDAFFLEAYPVKFLSVVWIGGGGSATIELRHNGTLAGFPHR